MNQPSASTLPNGDRDRPPALPRKSAQRHARCHARYVFFAGASCAANHTAGAHGRCVFVFYATLGVAASVLHVSAVVESSAGGESLRLCANICAVIFCLVTKCLCGVRSCVPVTCILGNEQVPANADGSFCAFGQGTSGTVTRAVDTRPGGGAVALKSIPVTLRLKCLPSPPLQFLVPYLPAHSSGYGK